ncbi:FAD-binding oxidoreductase [Cupriavidus sp. DB3]|uniref:FAD-binding oxidoreductase n=1 Tax=Cupriavidus sp. DB3 TaxID=2873259 RepID=UPI001CF33EC9|nr:FAD-binding oxidoreductase [Cupriavidus sp. DB3]MCA7085479.1 FAD-binding oxidoreductase [Cupriavidus sp. DB3]
MVAVSSWGRLASPDHEVRQLTERARVADCLAGPGPGLPLGMARSYGDVCLNPGHVLWKTTGLDRFIFFDRDQGRLACESGVLLRDIQQLALRHGWMLPVTPGTQLITVGGAIANDVHGKNHHGFGTFGDHVRNLVLVRTNGDTIECGPRHHPGWFAATVGGLGLTGVIVTAELQLRRVAGAWIDSETLPYHSLDEFFALADGSAAAWEHTVAWIDCLSGGNNVRGLFMRGNPSQTRERPEPKTRIRRMPLVPPISLVNRLTLRPFNFLYYEMNKRRARHATVHYQAFLYPLDNLHEWNRMYGPRGFFQYQSVVPREAGYDAINAMMSEIARSGQGSFLAVLKTFGNRHAPGMLSFPQPGVTLALDFPNLGDSTTKLFERLDAIVAEAGGRLYPAKDARMPRALFEAGYPRIQEFRPFRDPGISSALSRRLMGH